MIISNVLLLAALLVIVVAIGMRGIPVLQRMPCTFIWISIFSVLFIIAPIFLNLTYGPAIGLKGNHIIDIDIYIIYSLTILFSVLVLGSVLILRKIEPKNLRTSNDSIAFLQMPNIIRFLHFTTGLVVILGFVLFVKGTGLSLSELIVASRFEWFTSGTMNGKVLLLSFYCTGMVAVFSFFDFKFGHPYKWFSLILYSLVLFIVLLTGGRKWLLFVSSGAIAGFFDSQGGYLRIGRKLLAGVLIAGFLVFAWQFGRTVAWENNPSPVKVTQEFMTNAPVLFAEGDATYFYRASLEAIKLNKKEGVVYPFAIIRRVIFLLIPNEWTMGLKTEGIPFLFAEDTDMNSKARQGNMPPGLVGIFVLSFGWLAAPLVMALLTTLLVGFSDRIVLSQNTFFRDAFFASFPIAIVLLMRGSTGGIYFLVFNVVVTNLLVAVFFCFKGLMRSVTFGLNH